MFTGWKTQRSKHIILLKLIYSFNTILIKIPGRYFADVDSFIGKGKETRMMITILKKKSKVRRISLPGFSVSTVIITCDISGEIDTEINGAKQKPQKSTHSIMLN